MNKIIRSKKLVSNYGVPCIALELEYENGYRYFSYIVDSRYTKTDRTSYITIDLIGYTLATGTAAKNMKQTERAAVIAADRYFKEILFGIKYEPIEYTDFA